MAIRSPWTARSEAQGKCFAPTRIWPPCGVGSNGSASDKPLPYNRGGGSETRRGVKPPKIIAVADSDEALTPLSRFATAPLL